MTVREFLTSSLRLIGASATGETMTASEASDALAVLNEMLDSWSADGLNIYATTREEFALVASQSSRTMGTGGNFSTTRPVQIVRASVEDSNVEIPLEIVSVEEWAQISNKSLTSENPSKIYVEGTHPLETINFWPIPTSTNNLVLYSLKPFSSITNLSATFTFPPGYQEAIRHNLAVRLAPEYGKQTPPEVAAIAGEALAQIKRKNIKPSYMESDVLGFDSNSTFNITLGE